MAQVACGRGRGHVVGVQRQRQVQLAESFTAGQHVRHAGRCRLVAVGQVQPQVTQLPHLADLAQNVVRHVRTIGKAQRLQSGGAHET